MIERWRSNFTVSKHWYDKMSLCAVQLKRKLMLHRNGSRMLKATCSPTTTASPTPNLWTVEGNTAMFQTANVCALYAAEAAIGTT
jgi:hypothetical protein